MSVCALTRQPWPVCGCGSLLGTTVAAHAAALRPPEHIGLEPQRCWLARGHAGVTDSAAAALAA